jgi:CheY-like chemotaxis protein
MFFHAHTHDELIHLRRLLRPARRKPGLLIIDSLPLTLALLKVELQPQGVAIWLASDGAEAQRLFRCHFPEIDLVLFDPRTRGLGGIEVLQRFRQLNPEVRFAVLAAESVELSEQEIAALDGAPILRKPISAGRVAEVVRPMLSHERLTATPVRT